MALAGDDLGHFIDRAYIGGNTQRDLLASLLLNFSLGAAHLLQCLHHTVFQSRVGKILLRGTAGNGCALLGGQLNVTSSKKMEGNEPKRAFLRFSTFTRNNDMAAFVDENSKV